jgi:hypothetical protein
MKHLAHSIGVVCVAVASFLSVVIGAATAGWFPHWPLLAAAFGVLGLVAAQWLCRRLTVTSIVVGIVSVLRYGVVVLAVLLFVARAVFFIASSAAGSEFGSFAITALVVVTSLLLPELHRVWSKRGAA